MRRLIASGVLLAALAGAGATAAVGSSVHRSSASQARIAPTVELMVVGRNRTLSGAHEVRLRAGTLTIGHKRCSVPSGTPLAGLLASRLSVHVTDAAGCDPTAMFVTQVGSEDNRGIAGWEYKVGAASPSFGAGDPGQRLRNGTPLLWFWCVRATACQRTLAIRSSSTAPSRGTRFTVTVLGFDDNGRGRPLVGATVHFVAQTVSSGPGGLATLTAPSAPGRYELSASKPSLVPAFPLEVTVR